MIRKNLTLEVKKIKRSWCVCAGKSILGKFKTEVQATEDLEKNKSLYVYWSQSVSVSVENTPPTFKAI